jgi:hypothetical protein
LPLGARRERSGVRPGPARMLPRCATRTRAAGGTSTGSGAPVACVEPARRSGDRRGPRSPGAERGPISAARGLGTPVAMFAGQVVVTEAGSETNGERGSLTVGRASDPEWPARAPS